LHHSPYWRRHFSKENQKKIFTTFAYAAVDKAPLTLIGEDYLWSSHFAQAERDNLRTQAALNIAEHYAWVILQSPDLIIPYLPPAAAEAAIETAINVFPGLALLHGKKWIKYVDVDKRKPLLRQTAQAFTKGYDNDRTAIYRATIGTTRLEYHTSLTIDFARYEVLSGADNWLGSMSPTDALEAMEEFNQIFPEGVLKYIGWWVPHIKEAERSRIIKQAAQNCAAKGHHSLVLFLSPQWGEYMLSGEKRAILEQIATDAVVNNPIALFYNNANIWIGEFDVTFVDKTFGAAAEKVIPDALRYSHNWLPYVGSLASIEIMYNLIRINPRMVIDYVDAWKPFFPTMTEKILRDANAALTSSPNSSQPGGPHSLLEKTTGRKADSVGGLDLGKAAPNSTFSTRTCAHTGTICLLARVSAACAGRMTAFAIPRPLVGEHF
jgi:hypothetical protein